MKGFLAIIVVLLSACQFQAEFIDKCLTEAEFNVEIRKHSWQLDDLNSRREKTAKKHQIANMHELKYDPNLEKEERQIKSCDDWKHGSNYRVYNYYKKEESNAIWQDFVKSSANTSSDPFQEYNYPLHTAVISCNLTTSCVFPFMINETKYLFKAEDILLYGYRGTIALSDFQSGPPGSKCPRGKTEKGLCIAPPRYVMEEKNPSGEGAGSKKEAETGNEETNNAAVAAVKTSIVYCSLTIMILLNRI
ncbi:hypothetical protein GCK72_008957 [Caenorhabditis remanei]|uniref:SCP domain-containing protein n=1 Tax=Caenorhabditis remanei TaxID=31234 RepID=A0A6A5GYZ6_CAERE|nr:hypothetical protein GCK72_008957 [Caenorhabditis remanei]KAF1760708.1 hypothetical protein GCK72_008957 [Caenorhabditis remanei]